MSLAYTAAIFDGVITDENSTGLLLRDGIGTDHSSLKAQIQSGDYFAMLATNLDLMSQAMAAKRKNDSESLRKTVDDLLYLQQNYTIIKKLNRWTEKIENQ
jgi:hypothetical protein